MRDVNGEADDFIPVPGRRHHLTIFDFTLFYIQPAAPSFRNHSCMLPRNVYVLFRPVQAMKYDALIGKKGLFQTKYAGITGNGVSLSKM